MQLLPMERYVFIIALCIDGPLPSAPLNDGQNNHKNILPTIAIVSELWLTLMFLLYKALVG
jgi:hypothetical protein